MDLTILGGDRCISVDSVAATFHVIKLAANSNFNIINVILIKIRILPKKTVANTCESDLKEAILTEAVT